MNYFDSDFDDLLDAYESDDNEYINPYKFIDNYHNYFNEHKDDIALFIMYAYFSWSERKVDNIMKTIFDDICNYYKQPNKEYYINKYYKLYEQMHKSDKAILTSIKSMYDYCTDRYYEREVKNMRPIIPIKDCFVSSISDNGFTLSLRDSVKQELMANK